MTSLALQRVTCILAALLLLAGGHSLRAQSRGGSTSPTTSSPAGKDRIIITRQDDPLTRDPSRPTVYEREVGRLGSHSEVEAVLKEANALREAKPPRLEEAEKAYLRAVELNPKEARAYLGLGNVYAAQNLVKETLEAFQKAIELKPKMAEAHFNLGMVYHAIGKKAEAREQYEALQTLNKDLAKKLKEAMDRAAK